MKPFTVSHIVGYDSHLPIKQVKLPLKYLASSSERDVTDGYTSTCLGHSEFIDVSSQSGHFFLLIQAGITKDMKRLRLTPILMDEATSLGVQFQALEFLLPHPIIGKGTFTYSFIPLFNDDEPCVIIDLIDESYLLMTFRIELSDFLMGNGRNRLVLDTFNDWVNISVPYSFELRSSPFLMKALNPSNIIISMNDGGLLHFQRKEPLSSFDIYNFSDIAPLVPLNFVGSLFSGSKSADTVFGGLSCNAAVDIAQVTSDEFVTLSLNKSVKTYSIQSHKQTKNCTDVSVSNSHSEWLTNVPNKYFQTHTYLSQKSLSLMLPTEEHMGNNENPSYGFCTWDISQGKLEKFNTLSLESELDSSRGLNNTPKNLKIQDFQIVEGESTTEYYVLFKSNTYSEVSCFTQAKSTKNITLITKSLPQQVSVFAELSSHRESEYYLDIIFNSGICDKRMVSSALEIFLQNSEQLLDLDDSHSLRYKVASTVAFVSIAKGISENSAWYKFALICLEFRRSSQEALSIAVQSDFILCSEVHGVGVYREAHSSEISFHHGTNDKLAELVTSVSSKLSVKTFKRVLEDVGSISSIDRSVASDLASKYLSGKISSEEIQYLMAQLDSTPNVVEQINALIQASDLSDVSMDADIVPPAGDGSGLFSMLLTIDVFESIRKSHEAVLINLFVLLLLCEVNDPIIEFMNMIVNKLKVYNLMSEIFNICFSSTGSSSPIEHSTVSLKENSLFWKVAVRKNPTLQHMIQRKSFPSAFDYYSNYVLGKQRDETIFEVVVDLLNRDENEVVLNDFVPKMDETMPLNSFLTGITFLLNGKFDLFHDKLIDYTLFEQVNNKVTQEKLLKHLGSNQSIRDFLTGIFIGDSDSVITKSNYYHMLSQLLKRCERASGGGRHYNPVNSPNKYYLLELALKLENMAIEILQVDPEANKFGHLTSLFLRSHFDIAIDIQDFDQAASSLSELKSISSKGDFKFQFTKLMQTMIKYHEFERLFTPGKTSIYSENYLLVDSTLLELANEDLVLSNSLKCYELLYSWRLLGPAPTDIENNFLVDKRGAAEALYIFITRFQIEKDGLRSDSELSEDFQQFKLKILEMYKIILTTLKTFTLEEDKWIRKRGGNKTSSVITLTELTVEYHRWLKDLESDFSEN